jgi:hypothetical protein
LCALRAHYYLNPLQLNWGVGLRLGAACPQSTNNPQLLRAAIANHESTAVADMISQVANGGYRTDALHDSLGR